MDLFDAKTSTFYFLFHQGMKGSTTNNMMMGDMSKHKMKIRLKQNK
jgi:hypothetical protein